MAESPRALKKAVVLCTHNGAKFVREQLDSILNQSVPVNEIHIFDWGSTDRTCSIVNQWRTEHSSEALKVLVDSRRETPGPARSFLHATECVIATSEADLIFLADQDDIWMQAKVESFEERYAELGFDMAYSDATIVDSAAAVLRQSFYNKGSPYTRPRPPPTSAILVSNPAIGMTMCLRREWLVSVQPAFGLYWIMHDWAFHILCWLTGGTVEFIDSPLVKYRQHSGNQLGAAHLRSLRQQLNKARTHVANIRLQVKSVRAAHELLTNSILGEGSLNRKEGRLSCAMNAFNPMLQVKYQLLLSLALVVFWPRES